MADSLQLRRSLVFLLYVNRSGSTYLAARLAALPGTVVTVESEVIGQLLVPVNHIDSQALLRKSLDLLFAETKFQQWGLCRSDIEARLAQQQLPLARDEFVMTVLEGLPGGRDAACFVVKSPGMVLRLPGVLDRYPCVKAIHIVRDPRAVYASQRRSMSSRSGQPMVRDPFTAGLRWAGAMRRVECLPAQTLLEVRYEQLIENEETVLLGVRRFLGIPGPDATAAADKERYASMIPESQQHLHTLINAGADTSRITGWTEELQAGELYLLEKSCAKAMRKRGYESMADFALRPVVTASFVALHKVILDWCSRAARKARRIRGFSQRGAGGA